MKKMMYTVGVLLLLVSCVGNKARDEALNPIAKAVWPNVRADFDAGLLDGRTQGDLDAATEGVLVTNADRLGAALESGDRIALLGIPWQETMAPWANRGIQGRVTRGELGPNGAHILFQRVTNFTDVILTLQGRRMVGADLAPSRREGIAGVNPYVVSPAERRLTAAIRGDS